MNDVFVTRGRFSLRNVCFHSPNIYQQIANKRRLFSWTFTNKSTLRRTTKSSNICSGLTAFGCVHQNPIGYAKAFSPTQRNAQRHEFPVKTWFQRVFLASNIYQQTVSILGVFYWTFTNKPTLRRAPRSSLTDSIFTQTEHFELGPTNPLNFKGVFLDIYQQTDTTQKSRSMPPTHS